MGGTSRGCCSGEGELGQLSHQLRVLFTVLPACLALAEGSSTANASLCHQPASGVPGAANQASLLTMGSSPARTAGWWSRLARAGVQPGAVHHHQQPVRQQRVQQQVHGQRGLAEPGHVDLLEHGERLS